MLPTPPSSGTGRWNVTQEVSPIDDSQNLTAKAVNSLEIFMDKLIQTKKTSPFTPRGILMDWRAIMATSMVMFILFCGCGDVQPMEPHARDRVSVERWSHNCTIWRGVFPRSTCGPGGQDQRNPGLGKRSL